MLNAQCSASGTISIAKSLPPDFPVGITLSKMIGRRFLGINLIKLSFVFPNPILGLSIALVMENKFVHNFGTNNTSCNSISV